MQAPAIVGGEEFLRTRQSILAREKALMRACDELAAERRRQPWQLVERDYAFVGTDGETNLDGLFDGRRQLIVYHHMLKPEDPAPCPGCCMFTDNVAGNLTHLNQRDTTLVFVSRAPIEEIDAFKARMGWNYPFYSTGQAFNSDFGVETGFGLNVFIRNDGQIYRTYFTTDRGVEMLGTTWAFLDLTPMGRQETWEVSPPGVPQTAPFRWWRLHDEYEVREG